MNPALSIDSIVVGATARTWFRKQQLLPGLWNLDADEAERIMNAKILLTICFSPASVLNLAKVSEATLAGANLIIVDANACVSHELENREIIALILHEIGHVVNRPPENSGVSPESIAEEMERERSKRGEWEADDYARHCGFGPEIQSSIEKFRLHGDPNFTSEHVVRRLKRIQDNEPPILNFLLAR